MSVDSCLCLILKYTLLFVIVGIFGVLLYLQHAYGYWKRKGVAYLKPSVPFGNIGAIFDGKGHLATIFERIYNEGKGPFVGFYRIYAPSLLIKDPILIKQILVKDFNYFPDRGVHSDPKEPLTEHLFRLSGQKWKDLRIKLRPTFTSGKLKMMFPFLIHQGKHFQTFLKNSEEQGKLIDAKDSCIKYTLDVINSVAFGIETNSFENPNNEMRELISDLFSKDITYLRGVINYLGLSMPDVMKLFNFKVFSENFTNSLYSIVRRIVNFRETSKETRNDFLQLLIQLKNKGEVAKEDDAGDKSVYDGKMVHGFTFEELAAQVVIFLFAGFETSASTMSFTLYELAKNPEIQKKVQKEIKTVLAKYEGKFSYECVYEMEYLGMVISETLRMYPPLPFLSRIANSDYIIPDTDITLKKGTHIFISLSGLQNDPQYFLDPNKFDPERFSHENKENIVPYSYMPFGEGPRNCIGMQMGKMQSRVGLAMILSKYSFSKCSETPTKLEPKYGQLLISPKHPIKLSVSKAT